MLRQNVGMFLKNHKFRGLKTCLTERYVSICEYITVLSSLLAAYCNHMLATCSENKNCVSIPMPITFTCPHHAYVQNDLKQYKLYNFYFIFYSFLTVNHLHLPPLHFSTPYNSYQRMKEASNNQLFVQNSSLLYFFTTLTQMQVRVYITEAFT